MKNYDIFISYRRVGGFESANLIAEKLRGMGYSVFFDVESLRSGKFNEQLYNVIEQCKDFVIVLPESALDRCSNEDGTPNEDDWIRKEVVHAMRLEKNIVPVMLSGFEWPKKMPVGMEALCDYQSITATSHDTFDFAMQKLAGYLKSKKHRFKLLKNLTLIVASLAVLSAIAYYAMLQVAIPVCTSVANEYAIGMELVHELRGDEEKLKTEWDEFLSSYNTATSINRKSDLESDMLSSLDQKESDTEEIRGRIRPAIELSDWQTILLGLNGSQKEDVQAVPMFVESQVDDLNSLISVMREAITAQSYKPYETRTVAQNIQFYEHSVNMMYYTYLQEITKLPKDCLKPHNELSRAWTLLPNVSLTMPQEEYERLANVEYSIMEDLMQKMEKAVSQMDNETYDLAQRLDTLSAMAETLGLSYEQEDQDNEKLAIAEERVSMKRELVEQKKLELDEETQKVLQVYDQLKSNCQLKASDSDGYQWGKIVRMAKMLDQSVKNNEAALKQGIKTGGIIKPSVVHSDLCAMLDDYLGLHPESKSYINPLRAYYKMVADGKRSLGGQLIFAFKDDAVHPLYKVGDIIVTRNDIAVTDQASLASAVSKDKQGTVEFLRMEGTKLVLHKETVPETTILVGYMEVGEY